MLTNFFQPQSSHPFSLCFLNQCQNQNVSSKPSQPPSQKINQKSGLVWKKNSPASSRPNSLKNFFQCQTPQMQQKTFEFDYNKKNNQFERIKEKKTYDGQAKSIKKVKQLKQIRNKIITDTHDSSKSKGKISLSSKKQKNSQRTTPYKRSDNSFNAKQYYGYTNRKSESKISIMHHYQTAQTSRNQFNNNLVFQIERKKAVSNGLKPQIYLKDGNKNRFSQNNQNVVLPSSYKCQNFEIKYIDILSNYNSNSQVKMLSSTKHPSYTNLTNNCSNKNLINQVLSQVNSNHHIQRNCSNDNKINQLSQSKTIQKLSNQNSNHSQQKISNFTGFISQKQDKNQYQMIPSFNFTQRLKSSPIQKISEPINIIDQVKQEKSSYEKDTLKNNSNTFIQNKQINFDMKHPLMQKQKLKCLNLNNQPTKNHQNEKDRKDSLNKTVQSIIQSNVSAGTPKIQQSAILMNFFNPPKQILDQLNNHRKLSLFRKSSVNSYRCSSVFDNLQAESLQKSKIQKQKQ